MSRFRCPACDGEYDDPTADGFTYYHQCPPDGPVNPAGIPIPIANPRDENWTQLRPGEPTRSRRPGAARIPI